MKRAIALFGADAVVAAAIGGGGGALSTVLLDQPASFFVAAVWGVAVGVVNGTLVVPALFDHLDRSPS